MKINKELDTDKFCFFLKNVALDEELIYSKSTFYGSINKNDKIINETDFYNFFPEDSEKISQLTNDIYKTLENFIERNEVSIEKLELLSELNACWTKEDKIGLLKNSLKELWKQDDLTSLFLSYMNQYKHEDSGEWEENTKNIFIETPTFLISFLKGDLVNYEKSEAIKEEGIDELILEWIYFNKIKNIINFCEEQLKNLENIPSNKNSELDATEKVLLLEKIISDNDWHNYSSSKKGQIIAKLIDRSSENIRKLYDSLDKKPSDPNRKKPTKIEKSIDLIEKLYKEIIG